MTFSRRSGARFNRGRISRGVTVPLEIAISAPAANAVLPINAEVTISGTVTPDADAVEVYLDFPNSPIGSATIVADTWSIAYTPDLLEHGAHTLSAVATRGSSSVQVNRNVSVTAVPNTGTWSANSGFYHDFRISLAEETVGTAVPNVAPLEGTGTLVPTNSPVTRVAASARRCVEFTAASLQHMTHTNAGVSTGVDQPFTIGARVLCSTGSATIFGFGNSGSAQDFLRLHTSSGRVLDVIKDATGEATVTALFATDLDTGGIQARTIIITGDGTNCQLYYDGVIDANGSLALDSGSVALACNQFRIAAWPLNSNAQNMSGTFEVVFAKKVQIDATAALALHNHIIASNLPPVVGAAVMPLGDSLTIGPNPNGGYRKPLVDYASSQLLTIDLVGPRTAGGFADNQHCGFGGNTMQAIIDQQVDVYLGAGNGFETVKLVILITGTNDVDLPGKTVAQLDTSFRALLDAAHAAITATTATARIAVGRFVPYDPGANAAAAALVSDFNDNFYTDACDDFDAAHASNTLFRFNPYAAVGGWSSTYFSDSRHPNQAGHDLIWGHATHGIRPAIAAYLATIG